MASVLRFKEEMAHKHRIPLYEINIQNIISIGRTTQLLTSSSHNSPGFESDMGIAYKSKFKSSLFVYS